MKTLRQAVLERGGKNANAILNYMAAAGVKTWDDCTDLKLSDFVLTMQNESGLAESSIYYYAHQLQAVLGKYKNEGVIPAKDLNAALACKKDRSQKVFLNEDELKMLESYQAKKPAERYCQLGFLIASRTGQRISDIRKTTAENIVKVGEHLRFVYVSKKTHIEVNAPISEKVAEWIREFVAMEEIPERTYIFKCKQLCRKVGINEKYKLYKAGKEQTKEKWEFVGTHTARVSFCTNLYLRGVRLESIAKLAGHTSTAMTERYIATNNAVLNESGMDYLCGV